MTEQALEKIKEGLDEALLVAQRDAAIARAEKAEEELRTALEREAETIVRHDKRLTKAEDERDLAIQRAEANKDALKSMSIFAQRQLDMAAEFQKNARMWEATCSANVRARRNAEIRRNEALTELEAAVTRADVAEKRAKAAEEKMAEFRSFVANFTGAA